jgi:hypothetical protein
MSGRADKAGHDPLHHDSGGEFIGLGSVDEASQHPLSVVVVATVVTGEGEQLIEVVEVGVDDTPGLCTMDRRSVTGGSLPFGGQCSGEAAPAVGAAAGSGMVGVG